MYGGNLVDSIVIRVDLMKDSPIARRRERLRKIIGENYQERPKSEWFG